MGLPVVGCCTGTALARSQERCVCKKNNSSLRSSRCTIEELSQVTHGPLFAPPAPPRRRAIDRQGRGNAGRTCVGTADVGTCALDPRAHTQPAVNASTFARCIPLEHRLLVTCNSLFAQGVAKSLWRSPPVRTYKNIWGHCLPHGHLKFLCSPQAPARGSQCCATSPTDSEPAKCHRNSFQRLDDNPVWVGAWALAREQHGLMMLRAPSRSFRISFAPSGLPEPLARHTWHRGSAGGVPASALLRCTACQLLDGKSPLLSDILADSFLQLPLQAAYPS